MIFRKAFNSGQTERLDWERGNCGMVAGHWQHPIPSFRRVALSISVILLVGSCGPTDNVFARQETASTAKESLVGRSQEQILSCMGAPDSQATAGSTTVWSYGRSGDLRGAAVRTSPRTAGLTLNQRDCRVDIAFRSNVVADVIYRGRTGGLLTQGEQCAFIVAPCVR